MAPHTLALDRNLHAHDKGEAGLFTGSEKVRHAVESAPVRERLVTSLRGPRQTSPVNNRQMARHSLAAANYTNQSL